MNSSTASAQPNAPRIDASIVPPAQSLHGVHYQLHREIGRGAFGVVFSAQIPPTRAMPTDHSSSDRSQPWVAVKVMRDLLGNQADARRVAREVRLLQQAQKAKHLLALVDVFFEVRRGSGDSARAGAGTTMDLYVVTEKMDMDLEQWMHSDALYHAQPLPWMLKQVLAGLEELHDGFRVVHRDMKPTNVLVSPQSGFQVKICDFGLAKCKDALVKSPRSPSPQQWWNHAGLEDSVPPITEYVATRHYRAPELLLGRYDYDEKVDLWAVGCMFAKMLTRTVLFPGNDVRHQLELIVDALGPPPPEDLQLVHNQEARKFVDQLLRVRQRDPSPPHLRSQLGNVHPIAFALLTELLRVSPLARFSAKQALAHAYFTGLPATMDASQVGPFQDQEDSGILDIDYFTDLVQSFRQGFDKLSASNYVAQPANASRSSISRETPRKGPLTITTTSEAINVQHPPPIVSALRMHSPWIRDEMKDWTSLGFSHVSSSLMSPATLHDEFEDQ